MTDANGTNAKKPLEFKKRTLPIVLLLVIVPWVALALPGYVSEVSELDESGTKSMCTFRTFGWPLTQMERTNVDLIGRWGGGQFRPGGNLTPADAESLIELHTGKRKGAAGMFNLVPNAGPDKSIGELWTNADNWPKEIRDKVKDPLPEKGVRYDWKTPMMIGNIGLMVLASIFVGFLVEKVSK